MTAWRRLQAVRPHLPVPVPADAVLLDSNSNDAWDLGSTVLRVCWRGDRDRLRREAIIGRALPPEVRYPEVVGDGLVDDLTWMVVAKVRGVQLDTVSAAWLSEDLRAVFHELGELTSALHAWDPPPDVAAALDRHEAAARPDGRSVAERDLVALPVARAALVAETAAELPLVDRALIQKTIDRLTALGRHDPVDPPPRRIAHGDLNQGNVLVDDGRITALLDMEWARWAPPELELAQLAMADADPVDPMPAVRWFAEGNPGVCSAGDAVERIWMVSLAFALRDVVIWPPDRPEADLPWYHPIRRLRTLVDGPQTWR